MERSQEVSVLDNRAATMSKEDINVSARTLLQAGIDSIEKSDLQQAKLCLAVAEKLFLESGDAWYAYIARDWYESTARGRAVARAGAY